MFNMTDDDNTPQVTEWHREGLSGEGWAWTIGAFFVVACVFALVAMVILNYRNGDDNKTQERIAEVRACSTIENEAMRTLCVGRDGE
jgi:hypothetical protein